MLGMIKNSLLSTVEAWPYRVLSKGEKEQLSYEERACGGRFAVVEVAGKPFDEASKEGVLKLLKYVGGTNDKGQFGGYAKEEDYVNYAAKLKSALGSEAEYRKDFYFCNGYDPPMKPYGRRNEVWFVKE